MLWRSPRQTSSCRDRAQNSLDVVLLQKVDVHWSLGCLCWTRRARAQRGKSSFASLTISLLGSSLCSLPSPGINTSQTNPDVYWCLLFAFCSFCFLPELALPRCSLVSGVLARGGCNAGAGAGPASPCLGCLLSPTSPSLPLDPPQLLFSLLQERLQGEAARGPAPGP